MKRYVKKIAAGVVIIVIGVLCFGVGRIYGAGTKTPGTQSDPLVSLSYLEERLSQISTVSYVKVMLKKDSILSVSMGAEFIIYSGNAKVCAERGIVFLSEGKMLLKGDDAKRYGLCFAPFDGDTIKAKTDCTLYIKGNYKIHN